MSRPSVRLPVAAFALVGGAALLSCNPDFALILDPDPHGHFTTASSARLDGRVERLDPAQASVRLDGVELPLDAQGRFSATRVLDATRVFQPFEIELWRHGGSAPIRRKRVTLILGASRPAGVAVPGGLALRLGDALLDRLAATAAAELSATLDIEALVKAGNPVTKESFCIVPDPFGGCAADLDVEVDVTDLTYDALKLHADSRQDFVRVETIVKGLRIDWDSDGVDCQGRIEIDKATVFGDYSVAPDARDATRLDVDLIADSQRVALDGFSDRFTGGACDTEVIDDLVSDLIGDVKSLVRDALKDALEDPDGSGRRDSLVAEGFETAVNLGALWAPVADALGVSLSPDVERAQALRPALELDFAPVIGPPADCVPQPGDPVLPEALDVPADTLVWGDLSPSGAAYDFALSVGASALNQVLRAQTECGALRATIDAIDLGGGPIPLDAGLLALFVPALGALDPTTPLRIELVPALAPVVTGATGPAGEASEIRVGHWNASLVDGDGTELFSAEFGFRAGLDWRFEQSGSAVTIGLGAVPAEFVQVAAFPRALAVDRAELEAALRALAPLLVGELGFEIGPVALPDLGGLPLQGVEIAPMGGRVVLFLALGA